MFLFYDSLKLIKWIVFSIIDTHFLQGVAQTQDLLQAVWHQNYHGFSDYIHDETSLNLHGLLPSSNFQQLTEKPIDRTTSSIWNYHQKLLHDSLHTFGIPHHNPRSIMQSSTKQFMDEKHAANERIKMNRQKLVAGHFSFENVGFPALLPDQSVPSSRMPPPFPHSFGTIISFKLHIHHTWLVLLNWLK